MLTVVKRISIAAHRGGHDGAANGGDWGTDTYLFGIFSDEAVVVAQDEKPGAIHSKGCGYPAYHQDIWEKEYHIKEDLLRPGDFVAQEMVQEDIVGSCYSGKIKILAHKLPIVGPQKKNDGFHDKFDVIIYPDLSSPLEVPQVWKPVSGSKEFSVCSDHLDTSSWHLVRVNDGSKVEFEVVVGELGLVEMPHPYGKLWLWNGVPVAVNDVPYVETNGNQSQLNSSILGNREFFSANGFVVVGRNCAYSYNDCEETELP